MTEQLILIPKECKPSAKFTVIVDPPARDMSIELKDGNSGEVFQKGEVKMRTTEIAVFMFRPRKLKRLDNGEVTYQELISPGETVDITVVVVDDKGEKHTETGTVKIVE